MNNVLNRLSDELSLMFLKIACCFLLWVSFLFGFLDLCSAKTLNKEDQKIINMAIKIIVLEEGFSSKKYDDYSGYAIGYGTHITGLIVPRVTRKKAISILESDLIKTRYRFLKSILYLYPHLTINQKAAILSIMYNRGNTAYLKGKLHQKLKYCRIHKVQVAQCRVRKEFANMHPNSEPHKSRHKREWLLWIGDHRLIQTMNQAFKSEQAQSKHYIRDLQQYKKQSKRFKYSGSIK